MRPATVRRSGVEGSGGPPPAQTFAPNFTSAPLFSFTVGSQVTATVTATGKPTPSLSTSAIPPGLSFTDNGDGTATITGVPVQSGSISATFTAVNSAATITQPVTFTILTALVPPTFTTPNNAAFTQGNQEDFVIGTTGSPFPIVTVIGSLPPGISLVQFYAWILDGVPTTPGTFNFTLQASNSAGTASQPFTCTVGSSLIPPKITSPKTFVAPENAALSNVSFSATGNPAPTFSIPMGSLPPGLIFNATTGAVTGTPTTPGTYTFGLLASNSQGTASQTVTFTISEVLAFTTPNTGTFTNGVHNAIVITAAGNGTISFVESGDPLPSGLSYIPFGNGNLVISGTTTAGGTYHLTITAHNGIDPDAVQHFTLTVTTAGLLGDPSDTIRSLAPGATWNGNGNTYLVPAGIWLTQPVTVENATFTNPYDGYTVALSVPAPNQIVVQDLVTILPTNYSGASSVTVRQYIKGPGLIQNAGQVQIINVDPSTNTLTLQAQSGAVIGTLTGNFTAYTVYTLGQHAAQPGSPKGRQSQFSVRGLVEVTGADGITLSNVHAIGGNRGQTGYNPTLVGQSGFNILSSGTVSSPVVVENCTALNTCGDSMTFDLNQSRGTPCYANVSNFSGTNPGRQGVTMGWIVGTSGSPCVLDSITITNSTEQGMNFQSDEPGVGSAYCTVSNLSCPDDGVDITAPIGAGLVFTNLNLGNSGSGVYFTVHSAAGRAVELVTVTGGTIYIPRAPSFPPAGVFLDAGAQVTLDTVDLIYATGKIGVTGAWVVQQAPVINELSNGFGVVGSHLTMHTCTLDGSSVNLSQGQNDAGTLLPGAVAWSSTVTYTNGTYVNYQNTLFRCSPNPTSKRVTSVPTSSDSGKFADWNDVNGPIPYPLGSTDQSVVTIT